MLAGDSSSSSDLADALVQDAETGASLACKQSYQYNFIFNAFPPKIWECYLAGFHTRLPQRKG